MQLYKKPSRVEIVYFTGTGGTRQIANHFINSLSKMGVAVHSYEINSRNPYIGHKTDMMVVLFPVYAANAPRPVYDFIMSLPKSQRKPAVVISVSAGGEVIFNAASRLHLIHRMEKQGYRVVYESMLVMPSNFLVTTPDLLAVQLLQLLPKKVDHIVTDLLNQIDRRTRPGFLSRFLSLLCEIEKSACGDRLFGRMIHADKNCTGCGMCYKTCPTGNIRMHNKRPSFGGKCSLCLGCIYTCPKNALKPRIGSFVILKQGYHLDLYVENDPHENRSDLRKLAKRSGYSGLIRYLCECDN